MQVARRRHVPEHDVVAVLEEANRGLRIIRCLIPTGHDDPVVVLVLVVVASHLLLLRADGVGLDVGMQEAASPAHVFESDLGAVRNIWNAISTC